MRSHLALRQHWRFMQLEPSDKATTLVTAGRLRAHPIFQCFLSHPHWLLDSHLPVTLNFLPLKAPQGTGSPCRLGPPAEGRGCIFGRGLQRNPSPKAVLSHVTPAGKMPQKKYQGL